MSLLTLDDDRTITNPLLLGMLRVALRLDVFQSRARRFYHDVMLSPHDCPECGGRLTMTDPSRCQCENGHALDPTTQFQKSACCSASLIRKNLHYACSHCQRITPSRFLFDERLFDADYFRLKMAESRERKQAKRKEAIERLFASRSGALSITDTPAIDAIPGLSQDLDAFIGSAPLIPLSQFLSRDEFHLDEYRRALEGSIPPGCMIRFSAIPPVSKSLRRDRARRLITLLFMEQAREVELTQCGENDIKVERYETDD